jgi:hypothetical protein
MHPALFSWHVAIPRSGADHAAPDFAERRPGNMASADVSVWTAADGDRMAADRLAREAGGLNPIGARLGMSAPNHRQHDKNHRKSHQILQFNSPLSHASGI